jgi:membrane fusion protein (multidrug efflux system)
LESATPVEQITIPREAVLSDQRGDFVYVVGSDNRTERRGVTLGQSRAGSVVITNGLKEGERVVLEGVQRVQAGIEVAPGPADVMVPSPNVKR